MKASFGRGIVTRLTFGVNTWVKKVKTYLTAGPSLTRDMDHAPKHIRGLVVMRQMKGSLRWLYSSI